VVDEESGLAYALELRRRVGDLEGEEEAFAVEGFRTRWLRRMIRVMKAIPCGLSSDGLR
jgi:hypothetical protein